MLLLCGAALGASAAPGSLQAYASQSWQTDEGLPHNFVADLAQTSEGYLWLATSSGLARFDGVRFVMCEAPETRRRAISAVLAASDGSFWVGVEGRGVLRWKDGTLAEFNRTNGLAADSVRVLYEARDGSIWMGTPTGLVHWQAGRLETLTPANGLAADIVQAIYQDAHGNLWVGTAGGLNCLSNGVVTATYGTGDGLPNDSVLSLCGDRSGNLWVGTTAGLACCSDDRKFRMVYDDKTGLPDHFVSALLEDRQGTLWVGTHGGLCRVPEASRLPTRAAPPPPCLVEVNAAGLGYDQVTRLLQDREGDLWVSGRDGLSRLRPKVFARLGKHQGLSNNNAMSVLEDTQGSLWAASWGGGLNRIIEGASAGPLPSGFQTDLFLSLANGRDGSLWIGMDHAGGLYHWKDGALIHYGLQDGLTNAAIRVIYEDRQTNLWIGTSRSLTLFKNGHFTNFTSQDGLAGPIVRALLEDAEGNLWVGTSGGLSRFRNGKSTGFTSQQVFAGMFILSLYEDREGALWVGTAGSGLLRLRAGRVSTFTSAQGLFSDDIFEILEDQAGYFWLGCPKGVFRVRKRALAELDAGTVSSIPCAHYGKAEGLNAIQCNAVAQPAGWKTRDGQLWFTTTQGLAVADPDIPVNELVPPVSIEEVLADKKPVSRRLAEWLDGPLPLTNVVVVAPGQGELEFHYSALSLPAAEKNRFRYQLDGADSQWVDAGPRRVAYYTHLEPGRYRFRVAACNNDGVWNEQGTALTVLLLPHFWQTWWFRWTTPLAGVGLVAGTANWLARRKGRRNLERLEHQHELERERARIARDIHDDLGSSLTRIAMLSELAEADKSSPARVETHVRKIAASARETVQSLDEIVWAVSPENDTWNSLVEYLSQYASEFFENTSVRCRLDLPLDLPAYPLPSEARHGLFLVVKEALNNVLKHAQASQVRIQVSLRDSLLEMRVADNGRGFAPEEVAGSSNGNGLKNMRRRIESLGGTFQLESALGEGTRLTVTFTLQELAREGGAA